MIYFNGIDMQSVAPVKIVDVVVSPIEKNVIARPRAIQAGSTFVRGRDGTRTVTITFAVLTQNRDERQIQFLALNEWARSDAPGTLRLPNHTGRHLSALCTSFPEPSLREWWEDRLRFVFTCFDPYWRSDYEKNVACGTALTALGDVPPLMRITRTLESDASSQTYTNGTQTMAFSTIPTGNMVINLNEQTAAVNGTSIMQYYSFASQWIQPKVGTQTITGTGTVYWRERWA